MKKSLFVCLLSTILVALFSLGYSGVWDRDVDVSVQAYANYSDEDDSNIYSDVHDSFFSSASDRPSYYKQKIKRKIKIRYRAMYCQLRLTTRDNNRIYISLFDRLKFSNADVFVHDRFAYFFKLRGPPQNIA